MTKFRFLFIILALALVSCGNPKASQESSEEQQIEAEPIPAIGFYTDRYKVDSLVVQSGDTFDKMLRKQGFNSNLSYQITQICADSIDLRKIKIGDKYRVYYEEIVDSLQQVSREVKYLVLDHSRIRSSVIQTSDSIAVWSYLKPVDKVRSFADVTINSSLWNDLKDKGADPSLIMELADIYQWSVNFFALQKGDRFRIIYTQSFCEGEFISVDTVHFSLFSPKNSREVAAVRFQVPGGKSNAYWDKGGESLKRLFLKAPLKYNRVSSGFTYSRRHPVTGKVRAHTAVDYAAPKGTPVHAIGDGTVTLCGWDGGGGGNRIRIKHMRGFESSYMHLSGFAKGIKVGSRVSQGQLIGYVGSTGVSTGPHLDFRIWENGRPIDPMKLDSPASEPLNSQYIEEFNALYESYIAEIATAEASQ